MKAKVILLSQLAITALMAFGQRPTLELTFTAENNGTYVQLDSIKVMNRTQGGDTVMYWPDTVLSIYYMGIPEPEQQASGFKVYQNYPNPVVEQTTISLRVPEKDEVNIIITDILGRIVLKSDRVVDKGFHSFRFSPGRGNLYFFITQWRGNSSSIKILRASSNSNRSGSLEYIGCEVSSSKLKLTEDVQSFSFSIGDTLLYIGYVNNFQSGIFNAPESSQTFTFQFATNIPCQGMPTVEYEGQVYNTVQIFNQCWLKENLNVGTMIDSLQQMTDNGIIEKYCYHNEEDSCSKYGGLYQWKEMMQYTTLQGAQGICPPGFHLPTDEEWKILEGSADFQFGIGDPEWDNLGYRGFNVGINLKTTSGWWHLRGGNGSDLFGFSALPSGIRSSGGPFWNIGYTAHWWTSADGGPNQAYYRNLNYYDPNAIRAISYKGFGYSVRCLKD